MFPNFPNPCDSQARWISVVPDVVTPGLPHPRPSEQRSTRPSPPEARPRSGTSWLTPRQMLRRGVAAGWVFGEEWMVYIKLFVPFYANDPVVSFVSCFCFGGHVPTFGYFLVGPNFKYPTLSVDANRDASRRQSSEESFAGSCLRPKWLETRQGLSPAGHTC